LEALLPLGLLLGELDVLQEEARGARRGLALQIQVGRASARLVEGLGLPREGV
jgi:hypothetical protein